MKTFEIWFDDLCEDAKGAFLEFHGIENESELNLGITPIAIIDLEEENE